ncbi:MAG: Uncharacterised protein [Gammaproteobacteria bacterium]|nr:MAG: Uncharacterised protein [Gammaproteobacteria bacterium]
MRESLDVIHWLMPLDNDIFPSNDIPALAVIKGLLLINLLKNFLFKCTASFFKTLIFTSIPALRNCLILKPFTRGFGSMDDITTLDIFFCIIKSRHGGVLP